MFSTEGLRYVLYEAKGSITIVPEPGAGADEGGDKELVLAALEGSVGYS